MVNELVEMEELGWQALSTAGAAAEFYEKVLDDNVIMILPDGTRLTNRDTIIRSMSGQPWSRYEIQDAQLLYPYADVGVITYMVIAQREGAPIYSAQLSSMYGRRLDGWKLTFHQHTPQ